MHQQYIFTLHVQQWITYRLSFGSPGTWNTCRTFISRHAMITLEREVEGEREGREGEREREREGERAGERKRERKRGRESREIKSWQLLKSI